MPMHTFLSPLCRKCAEAKGLSNPQVTGSLWNAKAIKHTTIPTTLRTTSVFGPQEYEDAVALAYASGFVAEDNDGRFNLYYEHCQVLSTIYVSGVSVASGNLIVIAKPAKYSFHALTALPHEIRLPMPLTCSVCGEPL